MSFLPCAIMPWSSDNLLPIQCCHLWPTMWYIDMNPEIFPLAVKNVKTICMKCVKKELFVNIVSITLYFSDSWDSEDSIYINIISEVRVVTSVSSIEDDVNKAKIWQSTITGTTLIESTLHHSYGKSHKKVASHFKHWLFFLNETLPIYLWFDKKKKKKRRFLRGPALFWKSLILSDFPEFLNCLKV